MAANSVDFINEDNAGGILLSLLKQVADTAGSDADKHLNEVRTGNGKERNIRFAGHGPRQQRLAGSRRPNQQHTLGNASAEFLELLRLAEELDNFAELFLGLFPASHVFERDFLLLHGKQPGPALAERKGFVSAGLHLADHEKPQRAQQYQRSPCAQ